MLKQSPRSWKDGYLGMVEVSFSLMKNRNAEEQRNAVLEVRVFPWLER